jgi:hypothetical protein
MDFPFRPTLEQMVGFLRRLGFVGRPIKKGFTIYSHPTEKTILIFHDAPPDEPILGMDFRSAQLHLTHTGLVTDEEFLEFVAVSLGIPRKYWPKRRQD